MLAVGLFTCGEVDSFSVDGNILGSYVGNVGTATWSTASDSLTIEELLTGEVLEITESSSTSVFNTADLSHTDDFNAKLFITSTDCADSLTIATEVVFLTMTQDLNPSSGKMAITDSNGAQTIIEAITSGLVKISLDVDRDGIAEEEIVMTWGEFNNV